MSTLIKVGKIFNLLRLAAICLVPLIAIKIGIFVNPDILLYPIIGLFILLLLSYYYKHRCVKEIRVNKYDKYIRFLKTICILVGCLSFLVMIDGMKSLTPEEQIAITSSNNISPISAVFFGSFVIWILIDLFGGIFDSKIEE